MCDGACSPTGALSECSLFIYTHHLSKYVQARPGASWGGCQCVSLYLELGADVLEVLRQASGLGCFTLGCISLEVGEEACVRGVSGGGRKEGERRRLEPVDAQKGGEIKWLQQSVSRVGAKKGTQTFPSSAGPTLGASGMIC